MIIIFFLKKNYKNNHSYYYISCISIFKDIHDSESSIGKNECIRQGETKLSQDKVSDACKIIRPKPPKVKKKNYACFLGYKCRRF